MGRSTGWAGIVRMSEPVNGTDAELNAYIEVKAKNKRKATRALINMAEQYYPSFKSHQFLGVSPLDIGGSIMEAHILDHKIDELICDDSVVSMNDDTVIGGKTKAVPALPAPSPTTTTTPTSSHTYTDSSPRKIFSDEVLQVIASRRFTYSSNIKSIYKAPEGDKP